MEYHGAGLGALGEPEHVKQLYSVIAQDYTDRYFGDLSDAPIVDELISRLPPGARVLDAGCGPGTFTRYLSNKGFLAEGIDLSPAMLAAALEGVPQCSFREMDMRSLAYHDGAFAGVLAAYSLIHIPTTDLPRVLGELHRVLQPGGSC